MLLSLFNKSKSGSSGRNFSNSSGGSGCDAIQMTAGLAAVTFAFVTYSLSFNLRDYLKQVEPFKHDHEEECLVILPGNGPHDVYYEHCVHDDIENFSNVLGLTIGVGSGYLAYAVAKRMKPRNAFLMTFTVAASVAIGNDLHKIINFMNNNQKKNPASING